MSASAIEQILARVAAVVQATGLFSGVARNRIGAVGQLDLPFANIKRGASETQSHAERLQRALVLFEIELVAAGTDNETAIDSLHVAVDAALHADAVLSALGRGLLCVGSDVQQEDTEFAAGRLTARYQIHVLTRPGDLTRAIS